VILLVEDEPAVRMLTQRVLSRQGYTVLAAQDGVEAAGLAQGRRDIDLLITDVVMPHLSGVRVAELLRGSRPNLEVLYISGYAEEQISDHGVLEAGIHFLEKPFTPEQIAAKVRELIARDDQV
jgi:CheY-like chemotaxis protein